MSKIAKVAPELLGKVIVERIIEPKAGNNQDYKGLMVRQILKRKGADSLTSMFLGGDFLEQRVAVQQIHNDQIEAFGIEIGSDLSELMDVSLKVKITELTDSEYNELDAQDQRGFSEKENPQTGQALATADGEAIWRRTQVASDADADKRVAHVKAEVAKVEQVDITQAQSVDVSV